MPLNESRSKPRRERYPLQFDLEGVPRDRATREQLLQSMQNPELSSSNFQEFPDMSQNSFLSDKTVSLTSGLSEIQKAQLLDELLRSTRTAREIDLSKPVVLPYNPRDPRNHFPQLVYQHDSGHVLTVSDDKQLKAAQKRGYKTEPSPSHDYSKIKNGVAAVKAAAPAREEELSAAELAELDEADDAS